MPYLLLRQRVEGYENWKPVFDEHGAARLAGGSKGGWLFRNADDPNEVVVLLEWDDLDRAREFARSEELRPILPGAGAGDEPDVSVVEEADEPAV